jgi:integration host factor subunit beta
MIKSDLIKKLSSKMSYLAEEVVVDVANIILKSMAEALSKGQRIEIRGFGSFAVRYRPPRRAHNPKTGEEVFTSPKHTARFKPGKELRGLVNQARDDGGPKAIG